MDFVKIVNPCKCETWRKRPSDAFAKIVFRNGRLSITGVIGPYSSGNCAGSAGQCDDEIRKGKPTAEWSREMLDKLCDIWERWHLNDLRPYCSHMKDLGWDEQAKEKMTLYRYHLTRDALAKKNEAEKDAIVHLKNGMAFVPSEEQMRYANLPYYVEVYSPLDDENYEPNKSSDIRPFTEEKTRGWVRFDEDERGILYKPCPVCGYKYGTRWVTEAVPQDVIDFLMALPETKIKPAWV